MLPLAMAQARGFGVGGDPLKELPQHTSAGDSRGSKNLPEIQDGRLNCQLFSGVLNLEQHPAPTLSFKLHPAMTQGP